MLVAYHLARAVLPSYTSKFSRHDFALPQLFACLVLKEFLLHGNFDFAPHVTPPPRFIVPCSVLVPVHWGMISEPLRVLTVPVVLNGQPMLVLPVPPLFWKAPGLRKKKFVPAETLSV